MVIRLSSIRALLWFCFILLLAGSFPLQVYTKSPYPSLLPYLIIGPVLFLRPLARDHGSSPMRGAVNRGKNISLLVNIYIFLVVLNTAWQTAFAVIELQEAMSTLFIYLPPVFCYWYFKRPVSVREIRSVLLAIALAGLVVGIYFAYDSYIKLALGQVSQYAVEAFQYSLERAGQIPQDANDARIRVGFRSFGLLESHSVSGAWVILGALAALALLPRNRKFARQIIILMFGVMLLLALNFTSIVAFATIMLLFEFGGLAMLRGKLFSAEAWRGLFMLAASVFVLVMVAFWISGGAMSEYILENLAYQKDLALGAQDMDISMVGLAIDNAKNYVQHVWNLPFTFLIGDGFGTFGLAKGGDIGFLESLAKFGFPFFVAVVCGIFSLVFSNLRLMARIDREKIRLPASLNYPGDLIFSVCVMFLILITEMHYSIWTSKSILPVFFFALALLERYLGMRQPHESLV